MWGHPGIKPTPQCKLGVGVPLAPRNQREGGGIGALSPPSLPAEKHNYSTLELLAGVPQSDKPAIVTSLCISSTI